MTIKVTYNVTDVYMSQSVSPVYINVSYSDGGASGGGVWGSITGTLSNQTDLQNALNAKVPYSGATGDVSLGEYGINVGNVIYDTTPTGIPTEQGATYWDADAETVALIMNGTIQKIGEDTFYHVRNTTGSTIAKGTAVRFSGTTGNSGRLLIAPMLADGTYPSQYYMGITSEELVNNADGKVYHFGKMRNINTSAFADGDVLYVSPSVAGALTATAPVAPNNIIVAAAVVHAANNGTLMIRTTLGSNINADEGVLITTPTANQGLFYDSGLWVNKSITTALGYTPVPTTRTITINGVSYDLSADRSYTIAAGISGSGAAGQVTYWTGASAVSGSNNLFWDASNSFLGIGTSSPLDFRLVVQGIMQVRSTASSFQGIRIDSTSIRVRHGATFSLGTNDTATAINIYSPTNNVGINTTSDPAVKFGVVGDTLLRGSGNTSSTTALTVQNSGSVSIFRVRNDGESFGLSTSTLSFGTFVSQRSYAPSSGIGRAFWGLNSFGPTTGNAEWNSIHLQLTLTQGGTATGISRGLFVDTTLTSAVDYRAIETSAGNVLFGSNFFWDNANGRLGIGTNAPAYLLQVLTNQNAQTSIAVTNTTIGTSASAAVKVFANNGQIDLVKSSTGRTPYKIIGLGDGAIYNYSVTANSDIAILNEDVNGRIKFGAGSASTSQMTLFANGNLTINSGVTDLGVRFGVVGDTLLRGSGNTSATTALTVQNSSSTNLFTVRNDGICISTGYSFSVQRVQFNNGTALGNFGYIASSSNGIFRLLNAAENDFTRLQFGGTTTAFPALQRSGSSICIMDATGASGANLGVGTTSVNASAILQADSTTKGFLPPRMTTTEKNAIATPAAGLVVYDTTDNKHYGYNGTTWNAFY